MKVKIKILILAVLAIGGTAFGQNVLVVNPTAKPVPVNIIANATVSSTTKVTSTALEASHVLKASAGSLVSLNVHNTKASIQSILVINSATVPADGAVTLLLPPIKVPAGGDMMITFSTPLAATTGIVVCNSSTDTFTKTIGSADCIFSAQIQ